MATPALRNSILMAFSFALIFSHTSSTTCIKLTSAWIKMYSPSELSVLHSERIRSPASWERPIKYARGWRECFANCLRVASPIPLVAPTKTAMRFGGKVEAIKAFEDWTEERVTIVMPAGYKAAGCIYLLIVSKKMPCQGVLSLVIFHAFG